MAKKVLIIDDDEDMCEELAEILEDKGYFVNTIFNGFKAMKLIEKNDYDILLLDLKLPGLNGIDILKSLKERNIKSKVIVITGSLIKTRSLKEEVYQDDEEEGILKLADALINKPFDVKRVLEKIKELMTQDNQTRTL